jgi:tRNA dimethylallyltransferase
LFQIHRCLAANQKVLVVIVGPTAVGKTDLCVDLAQSIGCDIISCDSRQFYKEMNIGTAKPTKEEKRDVIHHFIDSHSVAHLYSAGDFERDVEVFLEEYFKKKDVILMTGGSGLFVQAVIQGLDDMPDAPLELREKLMQRLSAEGVETLANELKVLDPITYGQIDISNSQRVVRALEVCLSTGQPYSSFKTKKEKKHPYKILKIGLERDRDKLYERINRRVDLMLESGLVEEVKSLSSFRDQNALKTVGYKEVFSFLDGEIEYYNMVELLKRNTRRYAKRQLTWFKNKDNFEWFDAQDFGKIKAFIFENIA